MEVSDIRRLLEQRKGARDLLLKSLAVADSELKQSQRDLRNAEDGQVIIQEVAKKTQQELEYSISNIVSLALNTIFDDPYEFVLEFVTRRGKTEADIYFKRGEEKIDPIMASGGGAVDVAAFALRVALWSLHRPRYINTIILDEPFRFLSRELQPRAGDVLKMLSERLRIQFIMVTHNPDLVEKSDKTFEVKIGKGISKVKEL